MPTIEENHTPASADNNPNAFEITKNMDTSLGENKEIEINAPDIAERDNANLAIAVQRIVTAFAPLYTTRLIEPKELIRLVYRFVAETMPETIGGFAPVNVRGCSSKLPPTDPSDPPIDPLKDDPNPT